MFKIIIPFSYPSENEFFSYLSTWVTLLSWGTRLALGTLWGDKGKAEGWKGESRAQTLPQHLDTSSNPPPVPESSWERETASLRGGTGRGEVILGHNSVLCMDMQLKGAEPGFNTTWLCIGLFHREPIAAD